MRVILKWENRFGKYRRIMKPNKAQKWAKEFEDKGFVKIKITPLMKEHKSDMKKS